MTTWTVAALLVAVVHRPMLRFAKVAAAAVLAADGDSCLGWLDGFGVVPHGDGGEVVR